MKALIDTHVFLWWVNGDPLPEAVSLLLQDVKSEILISMASLWEMTIKVSLGKLSLPSSVGSFFPAQCLANSFKVLPIEVSHLSVLETLPLVHRDPFDRMIISQAIAEDIPVVSIDGFFEEYPIVRIW